VVQMKEHFLHHLFFLQQHCCRHAKGERTSTDKHEAAQIDGFFPHFTDCNSFGPVLTGSMAA